MRKPLLIISLLVIVIYACNQNGHFGNRLLGTGKLPAQLFSIDITKDTTLVTNKGAVIRIPHGALSASVNTVQLEVKEAYSIQEMLEAGLTTQSNGQPLSSGGMIYINAVGENTVRITQKISIATPTSFIDRNMQLFKGEVKNDSTINWTDPTPLPDNPQLTALDKGKLLFQNNCASCHALGKDFTGPDLAHVMKRLLPFWGEGGIYDPYEFTSNPARYMSHGDYYYCLKKKYGDVMMPGFPSLTETDFNNLYGWMENESDSRNLPVPDISLLKCRDSCVNYERTAVRWKQIKARLEKDSTYLMQEINHPVITPDTSPIFTDTIIPPPPPPPLPDLEKVTPYSARSLYYQFTIETFGWYNIDILMKGYSNCTPSELMVRIQGQYKERFSIYLIIPSVKALVAGGPLKDQKDTYGFDQVDGSIPLPQNTKAFIIAMGEREDQIIFAKTAFITKEKQSFDLQLTTITKEAFQQQMADMQLDDLTIKAQDTPNADELRKAIRELKKVEQFKPKNCDCNCFFEEPASDCCLVDSAEK